MFHLEALAERLPLTSIFQNMTFIHYVQGLANVTKIAKFNLPSIAIARFRNPIQTAVHYENMPMQYTQIFFGRKKLQISLDFFMFSILSLKTYRVGTC